MEGVLYQVAETLPADVLAKMHAPPKDDSVPVIDPHIIDQVSPYDIHAYMHACIARDAQIPPHASHTARV